MKIFEAFITNSTPELYKPEYQLCLILLDLYNDSVDGTFPIEQLHKHPMMNASLKSQLYKLEDKLSGAKIMMKHQWHYTSPCTDCESKKQQPIYVLFDKLLIDKTKVICNVNKYVWEYLSKYPEIEVDAKKFHEIKKYNLIRLYMWFKTWEPNKFAKCNVNWLKMYLDINVKTKSLNDKYIKEFLIEMERHNITIDVKNIRDIKRSSKITYIMFKLIKE